MKKLTTRWYYSFYDIGRLYSSNPELEWPIDVVPMDGLAEFLCHIADEEGALTETSTWSALDTTEAKKMWVNYLWPEFRDSILVYVDKEVEPWALDEDEPDRDDVWEEFKYVIPRIIRWLKESTERYSVLIDAYETIENTLLSRVTTVTSTEGESEQGSVYETEDSSLNLRNDTPQNGGDFTTDPYVSEANKHTGTSSNSNTINNSITSTSTVATDVNTPIERLNEIRQKLHNLYADWADEFARFVIYSAE